MALKDNLMPALQDREITESTQDKFGHAHFARALESLIESPSNTPPFSIGLLGGWGTGKSSIKSLYLNQLKDDLSKGPDKLKRSERVKHFTFNAWRYGGNEADIKRALLRHIYIELGGDEKTLKDELYNEITKSELTKRRLRDYLYEFVDNFLSSLLALTVLLAIYIAGVVFLSNSFPNSELVQTAVLLAPSVLLAWIAKSFGDPRKFISRRLSSMTRVELPRTTTEEYEYLLIQQLSVFKRSTLGKKYQRLVVFIDDLDRLSSDEMVSGLDAVRTFMEMPKDKVPDGLGIVFVISCDETRIATALTVRNDSHCNVEVPGAIHSLSDARRYLDRIFQFRLKIPPTPKQDMRQFAIDHLDNELAELKADLEEKGTSIPALVDRMIHVGVDNPRKAKQILNAFAQSWWIASVREHEGISSDRAGALCKGSVTDHPVSLAALCALRADFPDFYKQLQQYPSLIDRFRAVFQREEPLDDQPASARNILTQYSNREGSWVKAEYRPLRQYLASLDGHQWPHSLEPLLLLTQDPVSRAYPDGARQLYEALISGDVQGVTEEFSLHLDDRQMTLEQITKMRDLLENCGQESSERQERAAFVVAFLANRVPDDYSGLFLNPLCSKLAFSAKLRWRVGLPGIKNIISKCDKEHQQHLCGSVISDFLLSSGDIQFKTPSGQTPTLDEAEELTQVACEIALDVREKFGLPHDSDRLLLDWLYTRRVPIDGEEELLPFATLEKWVGQYENSLLPDFSEQYLQLLNGELKNERTDSFDLSPALERAKRIFVSLWELGKEGQSVFWDELASLMAVKDKAAIDMGMGLVSEHHNTAPTNSITAFVKAYIGRLIKEMDDKDNWKLDYHRGARLLIEVLAVHQSKIGTKTLSELPSLITKYLSTDATAKYGIELLDLTKEEFREKALEEILPNLINNGTQRAIEWVSENSVNTLSDEERNVLWAHVNAEVASSVPSEETAKKYRWFINAMPANAFADDYWKNHTINVFGYLDQFKTNAEYIGRVLPIIAPLLDKENLPGVGRSLQSLLVSNNGNPAYLGPIHMLLKDYWPTRERGLTGYNPNVIFSQGLQTINQHQGNSLVGDILMSIAVMVTRSIVPQEGNLKQVIDKACEMWPNHRAASEYALSLEGMTPTSSQVANLMDRLDLSDEEDYEQLKSIWSVLAVRLNTAEQSATANNIVQKSLTQGPTDGIKDAGLVAWVDALSRPDSKAFVLKQNVENDDLPEEARRRVWAQIIANSSGLQNGFFIELLPALFGEQDAQALQADILAKASLINSRFASKDDKRELNKAILSALLQSPSEKMKISLARWLSNNGGGGVLKSVGSMSPSMEDLEALQEVFPTSKSVKKLIKKHDPATDPAT